MSTVTKSEQLNELATSLSAFQGELEDMVKDTQGYGYKYAKLNGLFEIIRPLLAKYGLAVTQNCGTEANDRVIVETTLMHKSGQWMSSSLSAQITSEESKDGKKRASSLQALGIAITYLRRYGLSAIVGVTQKDEDAPPLTITDSQQTVLLNFSKSLGISRNDFVRVFKKDVNDLTMTEYTNALERLGMKLTDKVKSASVSPAIGTGIGRGGDIITGRAYEAPGTLNVVNEQGVN